MVREIEVVDPRPEALALGRERLAEVGVERGDLTVRWLTELDQASPGGALCILATRADVRPALVRRAAGELGYEAFLLEKLVAQSAGEVEALLAFARARVMRVWVNCKTRAYPIHQHVRSRLVPGEPIVFSATGGNHGLATNGVHTVDLFVFYDGSDRLDSAGSAIDPVLHPSKRGPDLFDLSGTLHATTPRRSHFTLSYAGTHDGSETLVIAGPRYRAIVDHLARWAMESDAAGGWAWTPVPFEGDLRVSAMTGAFVEDILRTGRCALPTLEESYPAHRFVLDELRPHFNRLLGREAERCPVT